MPLTDQLLLLGLAMLLGFAAARVCQLLGIPRVVGQIVAGLLLGSSVANLISLTMVADLAPLTDFALALIGFLVGSELKRDVFARYGRQMVLIMLGEGLAAFVVVGGVVLLLDGRPSVALLLGALASATAPAATVDVLWEYRARGPLTTTILGIVALDDGLALILYSFAIAIARSRFEGGALTIQTVLLDPALRIGGALALGAAFGWLIGRVLRRLRERDDTLVFTLAAILVLAGLAHLLGLSLILAEMALGIALVNLAPKTSATAFEAVKGVTPPIYVLFFVLVGARLQIGLLPSMGLIGIGYVAARTAGKFAGSWLASTAVHAEPVVRRWLGFALFSQAGVAVGLALAIAQEFDGVGPEARAVGTLIVNVIAATTFLVQIIGPPFVKFAVSRAGEIPARTRTTAKTPEFTDGSP